MAPSALARPGRPVTERTAVRRWASRPPFTGYRGKPDALNYDEVNPAINDSRAASDMRNLIIRNQALTYDYGHSRYEDSAPVAAPLPLGGYVTGFPGGNTGNPIMLLEWYPDELGGGNEALVAITADSGTDNGQVFTFRHSGAAIWEATTDLTLAAGINTSSDYVMDSAYYSGSYIAGVGSSPRGQIVFTNGVDDTTNARIMVYPLTATNQWGNVPVAGTRPTLTSGGNPFGCRSVAVARERLYCLNTLEDSTAQRKRPQRLRWTHPGFSVMGTSIWQSADGKGSAGYVDLLHFRGQGVKVLQLGDALACYFEDGVALLRWTGSTPPHNLAYASKQRGLLGTRAIVDIGGGVHFGAFTDGFWFFTESGEWREAGTETEGGIRYRKFTDSFFARLSRQYAHKIQMGYDRDRRLVYISFPSQFAATYPSETWIYDVMLDEMYPQTYSHATLVSQDGTAFGNVVRGPNAAQAIKFVHGSRSGHVWSHTPYSYLRDGVAPTWSYTTPYIDYGDPTSQHTLLGTRLDARPESNTTITYIVENEAGTTVANTTKATGSSSRRQSLYIPAHGTGSAMSHSFSGTHPLTIYGISHDVTRNSDTR